jgi:uncharacterized OB-fold protein
MTAVELPTAQSLTREAVAAKLLLPCTDGCLPEAGKHKPDHCFLCDGHHPLAHSTRPQDHKVWAKVLDVDDQLRQERVARGELEEGECGKCGRWKDLRPGQRWCTDCKTQSQRKVRAKEAEIVESTTGLLPLEEVDAEAGYRALLEKYGPRMDAMATTQPPEVLAALPPAEVVLAQRVRRRRR